MKHCRVGGSRQCAQKGLGVSLPGAAVGADLGGSSKYSSEALEDSDSTDVEMGFV